MKPVLIVAPLLVSPEVRSDRDWWVRRHLPTMTEWVAAVIAHHGLYSGDYSPGWNVVLPGDEHPFVGLEALTEAYGDGMAEDVLETCDELLPRGLGVAYTVVECATRGRDA